MQHEAKINQIQIVEADTFRYYASPINPILRELAPLMPGASPGEIAAKIDYKTSAAEDSESLRFLEKSRMLQKNGDVYEQTAKTIKGSKEAMLIPIERFECSNCEWNSLTNTTKVTDVPCDGNNKRIRIDIPPPRKLL